MSTVSSPPSLYEETQAQLRAQTQETYEKMVQQRERQAFWFNWFCVVLAAFAIVGASLLWQGLRAWLQVRFHI